MSTAALSAATVAVRTAGIGLARYRAAGSRSRPCLRERGVALPVAQGILQLRLVALVDRLRLGQRRLERPGIDLEQQIAFFDELAFLEIAHVPACPAPARSIAPVSLATTVPRLRSTTGMSRFWTSATRTGAAVVRGAPALVAPAVEIPIAAQHQRQQATADNPGAKPPAGPGAFNRGPLRSRFRRVHQVSILPEKLGSRVT